MLVLWSFKAFIICDWDNLIDNCLELFTNFIEIKVVTDEKSLKQLI